MRGADSSTSTSSGAIRLTQLVIPLMRRQGAGRIINVTSIGGKIYTPFGAWYHGTKFALEGMSDALRVELKRLGIDVVVIEPGAIKTEWGDIAAERLIKTSGGGVYASDARRLAETMLTGTSRGTRVGAVGRREGDRRRRNRTPAEDAVRGGLLGAADPGAASASVGQGLDRLISRSTR